MLAKRRANGEAAGMQRAETAFHLVDAAAEGARRAWPDR